MRSAEVKAVPSRRVHSCAGTIHISENWTTSSHARSVLKRQRTSSRSVSSMRSMKPTTASTALLPFCEVLDGIEGGWSIDRLLNRGGGRCQSQPALHTYLVHKRREAERVHGGLRWWIYGQAKRPACGACVSLYERGPTKISTPCGLDQRPRRSRRRSMLTRSLEAAATAATCLWSGMGSVGCSAGRWVGSIEVQRRERGLTQVVVGDISLTRCS